MDQLRQELRARNVSCKGKKKHVYKWKTLQNLTWLVSKCKKLLYLGLRAQLVSRLSKLIKQEEEKDSKSDDVMELEDDEQEGEKKESEEPENKVEEHIDISDDKDDAKEEKKEEPVVEDNAEKKEEEKKPTPPPKTEKEIEQEKKKVNNQYENTWNYKQCYILPWSKSSARSFLPGILVYNIMQFLEVHQIKYLFNKFFFITTS